MQNSARKAFSLRGAASSPFRVILLFGGLLLHAGLSGQELPAAASAFSEPATIRASALQAVEEGRYAEAQALLRSLLDVSELDARAQRDLRLELAQTRRLEIIHLEGGNINALRGLTEELRTFAAELVTESATRDLEWARVQELIGFTQLEIPTASAQRQAWRAFAEAFDAYATSTQLEEAREAYLSLLFRIFFGEPMEQGLQVSFPDEAGLRSWIDNALKIARTPVERNAAHWLMCQFLESQPRSENTILRLGENLEAAVAAGDGTPFYEQALFELATWQARFGSRSFDEAARVQFQPDYGRAATLFEQLIEHAPDGTLARQARSTLESIRQVELDVFVSNAFKLETEPFFFLRWKNMEEIEVAVYPVNLVDRAESPVDDAGRIREFEFGDALPVFEATVSRENTRRFYAERERVRVDTPLGPGAYVIVARGGGLQSQGLLFVSNLALVARAGHEEALFYLCEAGTGQPVGSGRIHLFGGNSGDGAAPASLGIQPVDASGLLRVKLPDGWMGRSIYAFAEAAGSQTYTIVYAGEGGSAQSGPVNLFAYADRGLAIPGEVVPFKAILRGGIASGEEERVWEVVDSGGNVIVSGLAQPDAFGCFEGSIPIPLEVVRGNLFLQVRPASGAPIVSDRILRIAAPMSAEFNLDLQINLPGEGDTQPFTLLAGEPVEGKVRLTYPDGGAVPGTGVQLVVERRPLNPAQVRTDRIQPGGRSDWRTLRQLQLVTDGNGSAGFILETTREEREDTELRITAQVQDRNAALAQDSARVLVTGQPYFVSLQARETVFIPGEALQVSIRTYDVLGRPVSVRGQIRLRREKWRETYVHFRRGTEISGEEYRALPERSLMGTARSDYRLKEQGFVTEDVYAESIVTNESGEAQITLENPDIGFYRLTWLSQGRRGLPVRAEERIWVAEQGDMTVAYRPAGVELISDGVPRSAGEQADVLIVTRQPGQSVLLVRGGGEIESAEVITLQGNGRLIEIPVQAADAPGVRLEAFMVSGDELSTASIRLPVVDLSDNLQLEIAAGQLEYEPGETAEMRLRAIDGQGNPVRANVSVVIQPADARDLMIEPPHFTNGSATGGRMTNVWASFDWVSYFDPSRLEEAFSLEAGNQENGNEQLGLFDPLFDVPAATTTGTRPVDPELEREAAAAVRSTSNLSAVTPVTARTQPILWQASIITDEAGEATARFTLPDRIGTWKMRILGVRENGRIAEASTTLRTRLPLVASLAPPAYLRSGDEWKGLASVINNTFKPVPLTTQVSVQGPLRLTEEDRASLTLMPGASQRFPILLSADVVRRPESGRLLFSAEGDQVRDTEDAPISVRPAQRVSYGVKRGWLDRGEDEQTVEVPPADPRFPQEAPTVMITPGVAPLILERSIALSLNDPELLGSLAAWERLMPAVSTVSTLSVLGFRNRDLRPVFEAFVPEAEGLDPLLARRVFDGWAESRIADIVAARAPDGGWSWMNDGDSDPLITAHVFEALSLIRHYGYRIPPGVIEDASIYLESRLIDTEWSLHDQAILLKALSSRFRSERSGRPRRVEARTLDRLVRQADKLDAATLARVIISTVDFGFQEDAEDLLQRLRRQATEEETDGEPSVFWAEFGADGRELPASRLESTSLALEALLQVDPRHPLVQPAFLWLVMNGYAYSAPGEWHSVPKLVALNAYLREFVDLNVNASVEVMADDTSLGRVTSGPTDILSVQRIFTPDPTARTIRLRRLGGDATVFMEVSRLVPAPERRQDPTAACVLERQLFHLRPTPTLLTGFREETVPLAGEEVTVRPQDRIEVSLIVRASESCRYLSIRSPLPAGFGVIGIADDDEVTFHEVLETGEPAGVTRLGRALEARVHGESDRLVLVLEEVPQGVWELRFRLRAEHEGRFLLPSAHANLHMRPTGASSTGDLWIRVTDE